MTEPSKRQATASEEALWRIFTVPEAPDSTLSIIEQNLSQNLAGFLRESIVAVEKPLWQIERDFQAHHIPQMPNFVSDYAESLMQKLVAHSVHTAAPSFIGHMTSALPYFVLSLSKMMVGLNQNLVKIETSKAFTPMERQVLGMMHHLVYGEGDGFYKKWMHSANHSLGAFCSGGTIANITALWIARNRLLKADGNFKGIAREGLFKAMKHYGYEGLAILVSERGHYSLGKAADVLGIGRESLIAVKADANNKIDTVALADKMAELKAANIRVLAIVGVAGTTETGNVDPLHQLADIAEQYQCHFHVDAAWGGATLLSDKYRHLLAGIERADSVTIDAHKQMYVPMGAGMVVFKHPSAAHAIEHHAEYILRKGSKDLGSQTLEGSRPGMAMLVHACLQVIGRDGYEILINRSLEKARYFATLIEHNIDFELITEPELCLLTYRYVPALVQQAMAKASAEQLQRFNELLNGLTKFIQKRQREEGKSFVSRTRLTPARYNRQETIVFRVVLANPLTTEQILHDVLVEQDQLAQLDKDYYPKLLQLAKELAA
ncbi:pyridoxal-dependent aspartate 1-decarboxylase PanP [Rheinheimera baltica]|uniref:Pyridoxal-dependent aspartate 1-decarboxylase n=1 Tax=Rheinheimera baltica TaxID=67576 RepID=A0ABT9HXW7_9GAMM|nr:putative pyridoxal-dependent aspartate 1-decarboxylase [Rheinheimera baltica]MDP5135984.1 putative pyridoxal-dependent aspartate 1-decarboxylase [Rheinheimera baltica]MDP5144376.1 putative pyridoxal-dependent aspartate 1-decarboxylase [Rheinheimera baltica]MDP5151814.1 putative pyridoxal-dependent aspartate 1-decarboxylase [Rheinheimera baltica]MDP5190816.1 putative pyridoxal-dependent aspartate 1-decarboxylase [Rheinheimera baltica]